VEEPQVPHVAGASSDPAGDRPCPWCGAGVGADRTTCPACGAAVAQRESIGDLVIPGLTSVDPALKDFDSRPLHLRGPSPSQGMAPAIIVGAMAGGPIGLAAIGGVAAVAAAEYLGAGRGGASGASLESVGRPSEIVLQALQNLDPDAPPAAATEEGEEPAGDDGRSIWSDLPEQTSGDRTTEEAGDGG
jgi:hypothetical protein